MVILASNPPQQTPRRFLRIDRLQNRPDHRRLLTAGRAQLGEPRCAHPAEGKDRQRCVSADYRKRFQSDRLAVNKFRGGGVNRPEGDKVGAGGSGMCNFIGMMGGDADDTLLAKELTGYSNRQGMIAEVNTISIDGQSKIDSVVDQQSGGKFPRQLP